VAQTRQILRSLERMLASAGSDLGHVLHVNVFLKRVEDFDAMNGAYRETFAGLPLPARTVVAVADLPRPGALLTMNLTAVVADPSDAPLIGPGPNT
jgi:2-iminobutanoate/2-iminopropanoate deaminase